MFTADPGASVEVQTPARRPVFIVPQHGGSITYKGRDAFSGDEVWWVDFSPFQDPGTYQLASATLGARSYVFEVAPDVYAEVLRTALRTFYLQRCGVAKPASFAGAWADGAPCHRSDAAALAARGHRDRGRRDLTGGWHDAGDYNKYVWAAASNAILFLLRAWERDPGAFPDGQLGIPESGNGMSDLLDEVKWELDFFLRMQLGDGSVLSQVSAGRLDSGASPPSTDRTRRFYHDPTAASDSLFAGSCASASRVFAAAGAAAYARTLKDAALSAWDRLQGQPDSPEKLWAAAELFRLDGTLSAAGRYVESYHRSGWGATSFDVNTTSYEAQAAIVHVQSAASSPAVVEAMRAALGRHVDAVFSADDLYRNGMPAESYHWGSNAVRAWHGLLLVEAARLGATGSHTAAECRDKALDLLRFFHGQNALSMVYLTNMAAQGGEHSSWQVYHDWFGQSRSAHSRARYVGKPASTHEAHYPYFPGVDNHGVSDAKSSAFGPPPGFVPGGPNRGYSGDARPPAGARGPSYFYRDWNDQEVWTARTWEITETSIGYQAAYVALLAAFASPPARVSGFP